MTRPPERWVHRPPWCVGISTRVVLSTAGGDPMRLPAAASAYFASHPNGAAGNGSLMRTAPVALAHLGDDDATPRAAREVSHLTHGDPLAAEGCVLYLAQRDDIPLSQALHSVGATLPDLRLNTRFAARFR